MLVVYSVLEGFVYLFGVGLFYVTALAVQEVFSILLFQALEKVLLLDRSTALLGGISPTISTFNLHLLHGLDTAVQVFFSSFLFIFFLRPVLIFLFDRRDRIPHGVEFLRLNLLKPLSLTRVHLQITHLAHFSFGLFDAPLDQYLLSLPY